FRRRGYDDGWQEPLRAETQPGHGTACVAQRFLAGVKVPQRIQLLPDRQRIPWDERQPADTGLVCYVIDRRDHDCSPSPLTADRCSGTRRASRRRGAATSVGGYSNFFRLLCERTVDEITGEIGDVLARGASECGAAALDRTVTSDILGDTINVAARAEQLSKTTGDAILLTHQSVDALVARPRGLTDGAAHALEGKSAPVQVFRLDPGTLSST